MNVFFEKDGIHQSAITYIRNITYNVCDLRKLEIFIQKNQIFKIQFFAT